MVTLDNDDYGVVYEHGFSRYRNEDNIDPSPWALIVTLSFCILLILLLPLAVAILQRQRKKRQLEERATGKEKPYPLQSTLMPTTTVASISQNNNKSTIEEEGVEVASFIAPRRKRKADDDFSSSMENPFCYVEEDSTFNIASKLIQ